jgi:GNAT superfamily N-acetyltransferase
MKDFFNKLSFEPLSKLNWDKFLKLFGEKGASGNCWCMFYRLSPTEFRAGKKDDGNKNAMKDIVWNNGPSGILAFLEGEAIAWCAFAPREDFIKLEKSKVHKRIDSKKVWSIPCFYIAKGFRKSGITVELLKGIIGYARLNGIDIIEAYPVIPTTEKLPDAFLWGGLYKSFERAGFEIVDSTSKNSPTVRYYVNKN